MGSTTFLKASPLREVRDACDADLLNTATASQVQLLYDNPLLWLKALTTVRRQIQNHIAKDRKHLAPRRPAAGETQSQEYLQAKFELDRRTAHRLHVIEKVDIRSQEVKALLGPGPLSRMMVGDVVEVLVDIAQLADGGDLESAADKAWFWAKRLTGER